jgi:hypothetical protein
MFFKKCQILECIFLEPTWCNFLLLSSNFFCFYHVYMKKKHKVIWFELKLLMHVECMCVCIYSHFNTMYTWMNLVILKWSWKFVHTNIDGTFRTHFYVSNMIYFTIWTSIPLNLTHVQYKNLKVKFTQFFEDIFIKKI